MKDKKRLMTVILVILIVLGGGILFYYWYQGTNYVKTQDARIGADTVTVYPQISGRIVSWNVAEGEAVQAGQNLGWQDTSLISSSSAINVSSLNQTGSTTVSKAEITSPISGRVIKSAVIIGQTAASAQTLAVIANMDHLFITANIEETKIAKVAVGAPVDFTIDAFSGITLHGKVEEVGQATLSTFSIISMQSSSGSFTKVTQLVPIKIRFTNAENLPLIPGMSAEIKVHVVK